MTSTDQILKFFKERVDHPISARELARVLKVPRDERVAFKRLLKALVASGDIIAGARQPVRAARHDRSSFPDACTPIPPVSASSCQTRRSQGSGTTSTLPAANLTEAMHGDRVLVRIERPDAHRGLEGRLVRILERAHDTVVGRFETDSAGLGVCRPVRSAYHQRHSCSVGTVVIRRTRRHGRHSRSRAGPRRHAVPVGRVVEVLGNINEPGVDTQIIIRKHNIPDVHSEESVEEARRLGIGREAERTSRAGQISAR